MPTLHTWQAWSHAIVPNFVTSNNFIAKGYARVILEFMREWFTRHEGDRSQPLYIVEIGSGHGRLAYLLANRLLDLAEFMPAREDGDRPFVLVLTDFTEHDLRFWSEHPSLQPLIEAGVVDTAMFDAENDTSVCARCAAAIPLPLCRSGWLIVMPPQIKLTHSGAVLSAETLRNPLVVIANYVFDTLRQVGPPRPTSTHLAPPLTRAARTRQDLFRMEAGVLQQGLCTLQSREEEEDLTDPDIIRRMHCQWQYVPVDPDTGPCAARSQRCWRCRC